MLDDGTDTYWDRQTLIQHVYMMAKYIEERMDYKTTVCVCANVAYQKGIRSTTTNRFKKTLSKRHTKRNYIRLNGRKRHTYP